jgi:hypothetical protein
MLCESLNVKVSLPATRLVNVDATEGEEEQMLNRKFSSAPS